MPCFPRDFGSQTAVTHIRRALNNWASAEGAEEHNVSFFRNSDAHEFAQRDAAKQQNSKTGAAKLPQRPSLSRHKRPRLKKHRGDVLCTKLAELTGEVLHRRDFFSTRGSRHRPVAFSIFSTFSTSNKTGVVLIPQDRFHRP